MTVISKQNSELLSSMVIGDSREMVGEVQARFEEVQEFLAEFRAAVEEFMVEDRVRHENSLSHTQVGVIPYILFDSKNQSCCEICHCEHAADPLEPGHATEGD